MLLQSFGVSQMKFVPALKAEMTSLPVPGKRFAQQDGLPVIVVYDRKGKWSSPHGGLRTQPVPDASLAKDFHWWRNFSIRSKFDGSSGLGWFPMPVTPKVYAPTEAI